MNNSVLTFLLRKDSKRKAGPDDTAFTSGAEYQSLLTLRTLSYTKK